MHKLLFSAIVLLYLSGCASIAENGEYRTYYNNDILISVQSFKNGVLDGISREYYESGILKHAIHYKNDEIHGMYNTYYPDGTVWINEYFDQGNPIGRREYDAEGNLVKEQGYGWEK